MDNFTNNTSLTRGQVEQRIFDAMMNDSLSDINDLLSELGSLDGGGRTLLSPSMAGQIVGYAVGSLQYDQAALFTIEKSLEIVEGAVSAGFINESLRSLSDQLNDTDVFYPNVEPNHPSAYYNNVLKAIDVVVTGVDSGVRSSIGKSGVSIVMGSLSHAIVNSEHNIDVTEGFETLESILTLYGNNLHAESVNDVFKTFGNELSGHSAMFSDETRAYAMRGIDLFATTLHEDLVPPYLSKSKIHFAADALIQVLNNPDVDLVRGEMLDTLYHVSEKFGSLGDMAPEPTEGDDFVEGGIGRDLINGMDGDDVIFGRGGDDVVFGALGHDEIRGHLGNDTLMGGDGDDILNGGWDDDMLIGEGGNDTIYGGLGTDFIYGGEGDDFLYGGDGDDYIGAGAGDDLVKGGLGNDWIDGDEGDDVLSGNGGDDLVRGGAGNDTVIGGTGNDVLYGDDGDDIIYGGDGDDALRGGAGDDLLNGGHGHDTYIFSSVDGGHDHITKFVFNGDSKDVINMHELLSDIGFNPVQDSINDFLVATQNNGNLDIGLTYGGHVDDPVNFKIVLTLDGVGGDFTIDDLIQNGNLVI